MKDLEQNLLGPLGIDFLPAGSTGTDKQLIGDIDLVVNESNKDKKVDFFSDFSQLRFVKIMSFKKDMD